MFTQLGMFFIQGAIQSQKIKDTKTDKNMTLDVSEPVIKELKNYRTLVSEVLLKGGVRLNYEDHMLLVNE